MPRINVVHICDKFGMKGSTVHGASRLFAWWMPRFDSDRFNVKLYALKNPDASSKSLEAEGIPMSYLCKSAMNPGTLLSFLRVARQEEADVLHLHGWISAHYGRIAGRIARVPTIMHEHGAHPSVPKCQQIADRLLSPLTHTAVAVSKAGRDFLAGMRFVDPAKIRIIFNGAPLSDFGSTDPDAVSRERERLGVPPGSPVIGTVGRLDVEKGIAYLLRAARQVLTRTPDARFLVIGDGPLRDELDGEARDLGIRQRVVFTGYRTDVPVLQSLMDVQVFASLWDGAPLTAFEAMAMGRAVVTTDVGGLGEIFEDGRTALVVPPASPDALAAAILRLLADRSLADGLASNAREESSRYDINRTVRDLESLYEEIRAGKRDARSH